jgi:ribokinase
MTRSPRRRRVVVVGDLVTDVVAVTAHPPSVGTDTPARIQLTGGGQAANTAAWLATCGVPVTLVATVGDDAAGEQRCAELAAIGVDCAVRPVAGMATGTLVVLATGTERTMLTDRGAADQLRWQDVAQALATYPDTTHLHLSGYPLLSPGPRAAARQALATARRHALSTSVDAASAAPLRQVGAETFCTWVRGVDLLLANQDEAAALAGESITMADPASLAGVARLQEVATAVVVKQGADGAVWLDSTGAMVSVPAAPVEPAAVVDPTGAGDAFAAGLLAAWLDGADPAAALAAGAALGAQAVLSPGARPVDPHR